MPDVLYIIWDWLAANARSLQAVAAIVTITGVPAALIAFIRQRRQLQEVARRQKHHHFPDKLKFQIHEEFKDERTGTVRLLINDLSLSLDIRDVVLSEDIAAAVEDAMLRPATDGGSTLLRLGTPELQTRLYEELVGPAGTCLPADAAVPVTMCIHGETGVNVKRRIARAVFYTDAQVRRYTSPEGTAHLLAEKPHQAARVAAVVEACQLIARGVASDATVTDDAGFVVAHRVRNPRAGFHL